MNSTLASKAPFRFSTIDYPLEQRWELCRTYNPLRELSVDHHADFRFHYEHSDTPLGPLTLGRQQFTTDITGHDAECDVRRTQALIRSDGFDFYYLCHTVSTEVRLDIGGRSVRVMPPHSFVLDLAQPYRMNMPPSDLIVLTIPRVLMTTGGGLLHGMVLKGPMSTLLSQYLDSLLGKLSTLNEAEAGFAGQATLNLVRAALAAEIDQFATPEEGIDRSMMLRVKQYIERHLESSDLCQESICRHVGISRSQLYRLFSESGGVASHIRRLRLMKAKTEILSDRSSNARIADIAYRYGFASNAHFSRAFRQQFGHTPRESLDVRRCPERHASVPGTGEPHNYSLWLRQNGL